MLLHFASVVLAMIGFSLVLLTVPLVLELLLVSTAAAIPGGRFRPEAKTLSPVERLMVLVPSHNEEGTIARCVESVAASAGGAANILVIAHNCQDGTAAQARAAGANVFELNEPALRGKGHALVKGFALALGEYGGDAVLVVDADSTISANLISCVQERLGQTYVVQCRYQAQSVAGSAKSQLRALAFLCMNVVRAKGRQHLGLSCGIFGNGFGFRKEVLQRVPYDALSVVEDLEFHLSLLAAGIRTQFVDEAQVSAEVPATGKGEQIQSARWEGGRIRMMIARGPFLLGQVLRGKLLLLEPLIDLLGMPIGIGVSALVLLLLLPIPGLRWYAGFGLATVLFHLTVGIAQGPDPAGDVLSLLQAPVYVISKIGMMPAILRTAQSKAAWVRTSRTKLPQHDGRR